jgi:hypothetical protein
MTSRISLSLAVIWAASCVPEASAQWVLPPQGRPVTAQDISGKKICWDNGHWGMYAANGEFSNDGGYHVLWSVPEPGVIKTGDHYRQIEVQADGQFHFHRFVAYRGKGDKNVDHWGKVCG